MNTFENILIGTISAVVIGNTKWIWEYCDADSILAYLITVAHKLTNIIGHSSFFEHQIRKNINVTHTFPFGYLQSISHTISLLILGHGWKTFSRVQHSGGLITSGKIFFFSKFLVNITSWSGVTSFKGYQLIVFNSARVAVGTFGASQRVICDGAAVTHSEASAKLFAEVEWTPPLDSSGESYFVW